MYWYNACSKKPARHVIDLKDHAVRLKVLVWRGNCEGTACALCMSSARGRQLRPYQAIGDGTYNNTSGALETNQMVNNTPFESAVSAHNPATDCLELLKAKVILFRT